MGLGALAFGAEGLGSRALCQGCRLVGAKCVASGIGASCVEGLGFRV